MDNDDLRHLCARLEARGLTAAVNEPERQLNVSNPLNSRLSEQISAVDAHYVTSFGYEIGERGREEDCAERIARILAVGLTTEASAT